MGHSLVWPIRVCAAEQVMVFRVLILKKSIRFDLKRLKHGVFYMCNPYGVSLKNYSCMQSETHEDHEIKSLVLNNFCVKKGQGLKALAVHLYPKYPSVSSPDEQVVMRYRTL